MTTGRNQKPGTWLCQSHKNGSCQLPHTCRVPGPGLATPGVFSFLVSPLQKALPCLPPTVGD